jgi:drug/metabolite transporter (DMT)-like permease
MLLACGLVEGSPPSLDAGAALGFGYATVAGTAVAFAAWFGGPRDLPAPTVGLVRLLNPGTGVPLATLLGAEVHARRQLLRSCRRADQDAGPRGTGSISVSADALTSSARSRSRQRSSTCSQPTLTRSRSSGTTSRSEG